MAEQVAERPGLAVIGAEYKALDRIPEAARTFGIWDQAALWFSATSIPASWLYGAIMAGWAGLPGVVFMLLVVSPLSLIPWALIGYIAAQTGGASAAIVRPAYGLRGSAVAAVCYLIFGFGWAAANVFIGSIGTSFIFKGLFGTPALGEPGAQGPMLLSILITCLVQGAFAVAGHRAIRVLEWGAMIGLIVLGGIETYLALSSWGVGALFAWQPPAGGLTTAVGPVTYTITLALLIDLIIAYNWTWEFIGDFSRFARTPFAGAAGPFLGANLAQTWWFFVGAVGVVFLAVQTGQFNPQLSDPSSVATRLGFGVGAYLVVLMATVAPNAGNIYASALGISQLFPRARISLRGLLVLVATLVLPLSVLPLLASDLLGSYIFFLDFLGAIVIPLWTITLVDYLWVKGRRYRDDLFRVTGGAYWYRDGVNWPGVSCLLLGTLVYWLVAFGLPELRSTLTATLPTMLVAGGGYLLWSRAAARSADMAPAGGSGGQPAVDDD